MLSKDIPRWEYQKILLQEIEEFGWDSLTEQTRNIVTDIKSE
jgi:hypothetical protein